jgi:hypothetical protein
MPEVTFNVPAEVEIEAGLRLPPGTYTGQRNQIVTYYMGEQRAEPPEYFLQVPAETLRELGINPGAAISVPYEVTQQVATGRIIVL